MTLYKAIATVSGMRIAFEVQAIDPQEALRTAQHKLKSELLPYAIIQDIKIDDSSAILQNNNGEC